MPTRKPIHHAALFAAAGIDRLFVTATFKRGPRANQRPTSTQLDELDEANRRYLEADAQGRLFPDPPVPWPSETRVRSLDGGEVVDLSWPSAWSSLSPELEEFARGHPNNATVRVRWLKHHRPAPALIAIHGWGTGRFGFEERAFRAEWLFRRGLDVVLFVLPFHGARGDGSFGMPPFPSTNPLVTNDGLGQAISDLRGLIALLRARGAPDVGVMGMSLGGFTTSLLATVEPTLAFAVPMIPVASLPMLMWNKGEGTPARRTAEAAGLTEERFHAAFQATSTLSRKPAIAPERVMVIAGARDQVIPMQHAELLRDHFDAREIVIFPGGHLVQVGRQVAFGAVVDLLEELEVLAG